MPVPSEEPRRFSAALSRPLTARQTPGSLTTPGSAIPCLQILRNRPPDRDATENVRRYPRKHAEPGIRHGARRTRGSLAGMEALQPRAGSGKVMTATRRAAGLAARR